MAIFPSPPPDANATTRGLVSLVAQTIAGAKTFTSSIVASAGVQTATVFNTNGTGGTDVVVKVGTTVADASVVGGASIFSARTGIGATEVEYFRVRKPVSYDDGQVVIDQRNTTNVRGLKIINGGSGISGLYVGHISGGYTSLQASQVASPAELYAENKGLLFRQNTNAYDSTTLMRFAVNNANGGVAASVPAFDFTVDGALQATQRLARMRVNSVDLLAVTDVGRIDQNGTDSTASPGNATINKPIGKSAINSTASTVRITNSLVTAASHVVITPHARDATCKEIITVPGAGFFDVSGSANATAALPFSWEVKGLL